MPTAGRLDIRSPRNVPRKLQEVRLSSTHFDDVYEITGAGDNGAHEVAEASPHPCPFTLVVKALAGCRAHRLRRAVPPRRIVRQRRPGPEQVPSDVRAGPRIRQPVHAAGVQREMEAVRMAMPSAVRATLEARIAVVTAEHGEALALEQHTRRLPCGVGDR